MARLILLRPAGREWRRGGRNRTYSAYLRPCQRCSRVFKGHLMYRRHPLAFSCTAVASRRRAEMRLQDRSVGSLLTLILRRIASYGLRRIPEIAQREAQKAFAGGLFKGIAVIKPTAKLYRVANHPWRFTTSRIY